eukprot:CAMPEP_0171619244 /NCGR_PEP_ID=MMETSP0990-20121206/15253_1 /TAXON_ID=483369 /ORGANISM="non described non described, Strain CCMP2098" /LENGTH=436 /DNA_ID=CAMNT_0012184255 /DNA_START=16 /DNA_END=1326 /DNA_ORIENTATION=+
MTYVVSLLVCFACVFFDTDKGLIGKISTAVSEDIPNALGKGLRFCLGKRIGSAITGCMSGSVDYVINQRNPILQTFYLAIVLGAYSMVVMYGYPMIPCKYLSSIHKYTAFGAVAVNLVLWYLACTVSPGIITHENLERYQCYSSDKYLFAPGRKCPTVGIVKPPRSKYCKLTQAHVARFDHFCPWLNQAVGAENYRWFLAFLLGHCLLLLYGALGMGALVMAEVADKELMTSKFYNAKTNTHVEATKWVVFQYLLFNIWGVVAVCVLCAVMCAVLFGFLVYHLLLAARNMTTNESYKWGDLRKAHQRYSKRYNAEVLERAERKAKKACREGSDSDSSDDDDVMPPLEALPTNHFNRGIYLNFMEVLRPLSLRDPPVRALEWVASPGGGGGDSADQEKEEVVSAENENGVELTKNQKARRRKKQKEKKRAETDERED